MRLSRFKRGVVFYAAAAIFVLSAAGAASAFQAIRQRDQRSDRLAINIPGGIQRRVLIGPKGCAGYFFSLVKKGADSREVRARGRFSVRIQGGIIRVRGNLSAFFNSLGQMIGSYLRVSAPPLEFSLGSLGINPLAVTLQYKWSDKGYRRSVHLPGPVELRPLPNGGFRLESRGLSRGGSLIPSISDPALGSLAVRLAEADQIPAECRRAGANSLDLGPLLGLLKRTLPGFVSESPNAEHPPAAD